VNAVGWGPTAGTSAVLADTGPLYAAADPSDQYHQPAQEELRRIERQRLHVVVCYPTILETHSLIVRRLGPAVAAAWSQQVLSGTGRLNPLPDDYEQAYHLAATYTDQPITLFDAVLAFLSRRLQLPVCTYDHHFDVMRVSVWR
jgi:predicted nucleic acid-binding protein